MTKENVLYSIIGLLLGYVVAFTFVTYVNQREAGAGATAAAVQGGAEPATGRPAGSAQEEEIRERLRQIDAAAREQPEDFDLQMRAGQAHGAIGEFEEAIDFLSRARELRPDDYDVTVELGNQNFEAGRYEVAERWYKEALAKNPDDINVRTDLGLTFFFRTPRDTESALAEFRRSLERDPRHELTLQNMTAVLASRAALRDADAALRRKSLEEAEQTLVRLEALNPSNPSLPKLRDSLREARESLGAQPVSAAKERG
ncbi:MAG TPA: tetratricopeptide repeat protein [Pyrinomonadaceae bacterium]